MKADNHLFYTSNFSMVCTINHHNAKYGWQGFLWQAFLAYKREVDATVVFNTYFNTNFTNFDVFK